jgi:hypothetical protein
MVLAGVLVLSLVGLVWATETASSETGQDATQNASSASTPGMPNVMPSTAANSEWTLVVDGLVQSPLALTFDDLVAMPTTTVYADLYCVGLPTEPIAQGDWTGVRLGFMLEEAGVLPEAWKVAFYAAHDGFTTDLPLTTAMRDDIILAYERDGEPLAEKQLVVPCMWGYKWIREPTHIELVDYDFLGKYETIGYPDEAYRLPDDFDCDEVLNEADNCESVPNPDQANADGDDWGDTCDNCPTTATPWYVPVGDDDCDGFTTTVEQYVGTDPADACPDWKGTPGLCPGASCDGHDAWPLDNNVDRAVTVVGDELNYVGNTGQAVGGDPLLQRLDINADGSITVVGDVLAYPGNTGIGCS